MKCFDRTVLALGLLLVAATACHAADGELTKPESPAVLAGEHRIEGNEILHDVARRFGLGYVELLAANPGVEPWRPGAGTVVRLPNRHLLPDAPRTGIVVNLAEQRLYYFPEPDGTPDSFPIGVGREGWQTPPGAARIVAKRANPVWTVPQSIREESPWLPERVLPGPDNPLGTHALYLSRTGYLIHGTNRPDGVGRRTSHGCIRLYPEHIVTLFDSVPVGTPVRIVDQPVKIEWRRGELYLEAHPTQAEADLIEAGQRPSQPPTHLGDTIARLRHMAGTEAHRLDLRQAATAIVERRGIPVRVTRSGHGAAGGTAVRDDAPNGIRAASKKSPGTGEYLRLL